MLNTTFLRKPSLARILPFPGWPGPTLGSQPLRAAASPRVPLTDPLSFTSWIMGCWSSQVACSPQGHVPIFREGPRLGQGLPASECQSRGLSPAYLMLSHPTLCLSPPFLPALERIVNAPLRREAAAEGHRPGGCAAFSQEEGVAAEGGMQQKARVQEGMQQFLQMKTPDFMSLAASQDCLARPLLHSKSPSF